MGRSRKNAEGTWGVSVIDMQKQHCNRALLVLSVDCGQAQWLDRPVGESRPREEREDKPSLQQTKKSDAGRPEQQDAVQRMTTMAWNPT